MKRKMTDVLNETVSSWTVLIVDDTPDNLTVAKTVLEYYGAHVVTASGGAIALELLNSVQPTLILLDIRMPDMDGWAVFHAIRANPKTTHIPVIALTAYAMNSDRTAILEGGFNGYIPKPLDIFTFVEDVANFIRTPTNQTLHNDVSV
jgi:two-component system cell cycle response regulator DivK